MCVFILLSYETRLFYVSGACMGEDAAKVCVHSRGRHVGVDGARGLFAHTFVIPISISASVYPRPLCRSFLALRCSA